MVRCGSGCDGQIVKVCVGYFLFGINQNRNIRHHAATTHTQTCSIQVLHTFVHLMSTTVAKLEQLEHTYNRSTLSFVTGAENGLRTKCILPIVAFAELSEMRVIDFALVSEIE